MFPNEEHQQKGIFQLLLHFMWTWIGLIHLDDETGEKFVQNMLPMLSQSGICFDFIVRTPPMGSSNDLSKVADASTGICNVVMGSTANVVILHGEVQAMLTLRLLLRFSEFEGIPVMKKVWILPSLVDFISHSFQRSWGLDYIHGVISFAIHAEEVLGFQTFIRNRKPALEKEDGFIKDFWQVAFECVFPDSMTKKKGDEEICTGEEQWETLPESVFKMSMSSHSYSLYNGINAVAHALHTMSLSQFKDRAMVGEGRQKLLNQQPWQVTS